MIQKRIIQKLKQVYPKRSHLVTTLSGLLNLSKRAIYSRLESKTTFTIEEVGLIIQKFQIPPDELFTTGSFSKQFDQSDSPISQKKFIDKILSDWKNQVERLREKDQATIFLFTNSLPFSFALNFPDLIKYRLYCMMRYLWKSPEHLNQSLDLSNQIFDTVPFHCEQINKIYNQLSVTEIWGSSTYYSCLRHIDYLYNNDLLNSNNGKLLLNNLKKLIHLAQQFAKNGRKQRKAIFKLQTKAPNYTLIVNDILLVDEYTIMAWQENGHQQLYINHPLHGEINDVNQKEHIERYCLLLQKTGTQISVANSTTRNAYFKKINTAIDQVDKRAII